MANLEQHPLYPGEGMVPLFISGGILKEPAQLEAFMKTNDGSMPVLTLGSFSLEEWPGNASSGEQDFVYYPDQQMAGNARGLPNPGSEGIKALKEPIRRLTDLGTKTIISIVSLPHESPLEVIPYLAEIANKSQPTAIEVNLSCPNGKRADGSLQPPLCNDIDASGEVMAAARMAVGSDICLGAKDSPHVLSLGGIIDEETIKALASSIGPNIDFLTGINPIPNQPFPEITCTDGRGGMSGPVVANIAKQQLKAWVKYAPDLAKLSCGGIDSNNLRTELRQRLMLGAMLVGGAQEFYRESSPRLVADRWVQALRTLS